MMNSSLSNAVNSKVSLFIHANASEKAISAFTEKAISAFTEKAISAFTEKAISAFIEKSGRHQTLPRGLVMCMSTLWAPSRQRADTNTSSQWSTGPQGGQRLSQSRTQQQRQFCRPS